MEITDTELKRLGRGDDYGESGKPNTGYNTPAVTGTPNALYTNVKNKLWRMFFVEESD